MKKILVWFCLLIAGYANAQVQVSQEPFHHLVFQNKYARLLDVWIKPGDTTQFHIHSTPSVITHFTKTKIKTQLQGKQWEEETNSKGNTSYKDFKNSIVHRVINADSLDFHVMVLELLAPFDTNYRHRPLPYSIVFENEKLVAYQVNNQSLGQEINRSRRPLFAQLVSGEKILYHDQVMTDSKEFMEGKFLYIEQGSSFYFSSSSSMPVKMIVYEIK
jgi:hypothetical protein